MTNPPPRQVAIVAALAAVIALGAAWIVLRGFASAPAAGPGGPDLPDGAIPAPLPATVTTEAALKVAFIGDTGAGANFQRVLALIKAEQALAIVHAGDAIYEDTPAQFWAAVDKILGHGFPYLLAEGNHDAAHWPELTRHGLQHVQAMGAEITATTLESPVRHIVFKGLSVLLLGERVRPGDPGYVIQRLAYDAHVWKVCVWHKNQRALQVGGKQDEMGWGVYEACRRMGALIVTAHEHSYQRTKTLVDTVTQTVDPACADARRSCVRPGAVPVFVSGLGGQSVRGQERCRPTSPPYGCHGEWAAIYTKDQGAMPGALFITFNADGDRGRATGYFKNVDGQIVDEFELRAQ